MNPRRRLLVALAAVGLVLLAGRMLAMIYTDYAWYRAPGATSLWKERVRDIAVIHLVSATFAGLFALVNLSVLRRSIVSLAFPRRLGNVEFGEAVPHRYIDGVAFFLSGAVAVAMSFAAPRWQDLALVRASPRFGEADPFFQMDLGFYVAWIPLEIAVYTWALILLIVVSALVIGLYALTPSLRWHEGAFHVSVRARRHLTVLASLLLVTLAWRYRLDGYGLLMHGSGPAGAFSYIDHQWLIPAYLSLSVGTVAGAALVLASGWAGQIRASFFTVSAVLIFSVTIGLVLPSLVRSIGSASTTGVPESPYQATREIFTRRAYGLRAPGVLSQPAENTRFSVFSDSTRVAALVEGARSDALIYPGAVGAALVKNGAGVNSPVLGSGLRRLAHAWSEQRLDLMWSDLPPPTRIVTTRDVRERLKRLTPVFDQGSDVTPAYIADTLFWVVQLYSASVNYPLSEHHVLAGEERSYFRHAGTGMINSRTARVTVVPAPSPDPIAASWRARFPAVFRSGSPDILSELSPVPTTPFGRTLPSGIAGTGDSAFRVEVNRLYKRMRATLAAGDLPGFAAAYDSLGRVIGRD
ncbi:MAG: UPF0182 family protein [Gemmatimonadaceae bacterium]